MGPGSPPALRWKVGVREKPFALGIWRARAPPRGTSEPSGGPFGLGPLAIAAKLGASPATPALRGPRTWLRPFSNRLGRKLSARLVSWAAGRALCGRAGNGGGCGAATGGRSSTWVRARSGFPGPAASGRGEGACPGLVLRALLRFLSPEPLPSHPLPPPQASSSIFQETMTQ